jgi:hypothetical protein
MQQNNSKVSNKATFISVKSNGEDYRVQETAMIHLVQVVSFHSHGIFPLPVEFLSTVLKGMLLIEKSFNSHMNYITAFPYNLFLLSKCSFRSYIY